jgi:hypothetical protein
MAYKNKADAQANKKLYYLKHRTVILRRAKLWNQKNLSRVKEIKATYDLKQYYRGK